MQGCHILAAGLRGYRVEAVRLQVHHIVAAELLGDRSIFCTHGMMADIVRVLRTVWVGIVDSICVEHGCVMFASEFHVQGGSEFATRVEKHMTMISDPKNA